MLGVHFLGLGMVIWLLHLSDEVLPILGTVLGEPFNNFGNSARNVARDQVETLYKFVFEFSEEHFNFSMPSCKHFQSLFRIGMRDISLRASKDGGGRSNGGSHVRNVQ